MNMPIEALAKARRETMRWLLLVALNTVRPDTLSPALLKSVLEGTISGVTEREVLVELDYLENRVLVKLHRNPLGQVSVDISRHGIDLVEYTSDCQPGIARPQIG